ncbi:MAG: AhpC/TSA family protein [Muribaculaceae bacterium]|nr:AhpC/TSA family protein [Muribaculaceae bacterium]
MKTSTLTLSLCSVILLAFGSCRKESRLHIQFPERYEGKTVELMDYKDSTLVATAVVKDGEATFVTVESDSVRFPAFMQVSVDGRVNAFYVAEPGDASVTDSTSVATGTPLNDRLSELMARLDSVENLDDIALYVDFAEKQYNANRDNPLGDYFGIEWLKYAEPQRVDSMLAAASPEFRASKRVRHYENFARHRMQTAPGRKYIDFAGETADGRSQKLSSLLPAGKYAVIDFWASWCPYCIKELPDLKALRADYGDMLEIVGVAVRDLPEDTRAMVEKQEIVWPVLYNTERVPYDIYGFSGIPHHILVAPDGTIVSRGESAAQLRDRLAGIRNSKN